MSYTTNKEVRIEEVRFRRSGWERAFGVSVPGYAISSGSFPGRGAAGRPGKKENGFV